MYGGEGENGFGVEFFGVDDDYVLLVVEVDFVGGVVECVS